MTTDVVPYTRRPDQPRDWLQLQNPALELANQIAGTEFVPTSLRGNPAAITAAILYGDEVGLGPMQSLAKIAVINGRPTLAAEAQRALILAAGHDLWIEETNITRCTVAGRRKDSENTSRVTWTMDDAKRANLAGKPPWRAYPRQMLLARASAELARAVFPDAIGGLAASEELEDTADSPVANGQPAQPAAAPAEPKTRRRRASVSAPAATTPPAPAPAAPEAPPVPGDEDQPPADAETDAPKMSDAQRKKMHALFREKGLDGRAVRLSFCSAVVGRPVPTSDELTVEEASKIIDQLDGYDVDNPQSWPLPENY